jgi:peptide-methionine (S)-S-oxide reductase
VKCREAIAELTADEPSALNFLQFSILSAFPNDEIIFLAASQDLLEIFFHTHDPTTRNRQGNDVGPQYRSVIFSHDPSQKKIADEYIQQLNESGAFERPIVTEVVPFESFYPAEEYHHDYFERNPYQPYCQYVIRPKIQKFREAFEHKLAE